MILRIDVLLSILHEGIIDWIWFDLGDDVDDALELMNLAGWRP